MARGRQELLVQCFTLLFLSLSLPFLASAAGRRTLAAAGSGGAAEVGRVSEFEGEIEVVEAASGIPSDLVYKVAGERRLVVLATVSEAYIGLAQNWMQSLHGLGYSSHVLVVALDDATFTSLHATWPGHVIRASNASAGVMLALKPTYIQALLSLNVTVFINDVDSVWIRDPFPFLNSTEYDVLLQEDVTTLQDVASRFKDGMPGDPVPQTGQLHHVCDCLMLVRPTKGGKKFSEHWHSNILEISTWQHKLTDVQAELNSVVRMVAAQPDASGGGPVTSVGILPVHLFPTGCMFFGGELPGHPCFKLHEELEHLRLGGNADVVMVHSRPGSTVAQKEEQFKNKHLWHEASKREPQTPKAGASEGQESSRNGTSSRDQAGLRLAQVVQGFVGEDRFVILVTVDAGYLDMLHNWHISVSKFGYGAKVLFACEDEEAFRFCNSMWPDQTAFPYRGEVIPGDSEGEFGSKYYNEIIDRRHAYIVTLLELNYTVLLSDIDMVWLKDPSQYFAEDYEVLFQQDGNIYSEYKKTWLDGKVIPIRETLPRFSVCGCLVRIRPTTGGRDLMRRWRDEVQTRKAQGGRAVLDQPLLQYVFERTDPTSTKLGLLPPPLFPSGCLVYQAPACKHESYREDMARGQVFPVIAHANFLVGKAEKVKALKKMYWWFLDDNGNSTHR